MATIINEIKKLKEEGSDWDIGNKVLYDLCDEYPKHKDEKEIMAKVWLIGRAYAASIERLSQNLRKVMSLMIF